MKTLRVFLVGALCSVPAVALAQKGDQKGDQKGEKKPDVAPVNEEEGGQDVEMEEDAPPEDMEGVNENPDAPRLGEEDKVEENPTPGVVRTGYPIEEVLRPITLPAVTTEVGLDVRSTFEDFDAGFGLRARYGITRQAQLGLRYSIGGLYDDPATLTDDSIGFNTGKAVGLDFTYLVFDWMAGKITVPVYVDPFAIGITLGAPMKFRFGDKLAIVCLDDFLDIRIAKFVPDLYDERNNERHVEDDMTGTRVPTSLIHARGGVIYQQAPDLAIKGNLNVTVINGASDTNVSTTTPIGIEAAVQYSPMQKMDVTGRLGFDDLSDATKSFGIIVAAAYRI